MTRLLPVDQERLKTVYAEQAAQGPWEGGGASSVDKTVHRSYVTETEINVRKEEAQAAL